MSTLILALFSALGDRGSARDRKSHDELLRLAGSLYSSTLELRKGSLLPLASRLQFRALEVEGRLESAFASVLSGVRRSHLSLTLEAVRKGQEALDHALDRGLLSPEYFLELNADWERLGCRVRRYERNLP